MCVSHPAFKWSFLPFCPIFLFPLSLLFFLSLTLSLLHSLLWTSTMVAALSRLCYPLNLWPDLALDERDHSNCLLHLVSPLAKWTVLGWLCFAFVPRCSAALPADSQSAVCQLVGCVLWAAVGIVLPRLSLSCTLPLCLATALPPVVAWQTQRSEQAADIYFVVALSWSTTPNRGLCLVTVRYVDNHCGCLFYCLWKS